MAVKKPTKGGNEVNKIAWSREAWDTSISSRAYNEDWWNTLTPEKERQLWEELEAIFNEEAMIGDVPDWAEEIVVRMMELPMCGYYAFPDNIMQIIDAISCQQCPDVVMRCYTVEKSRKTLMSYYVYCLDAWYKDAALELVIAELSLRDQLGKNWEQIASSIYETLGQKTEIKKLVVERLIHRLRWWIKSLIWTDDKRDRFMLDVYSGDIRGDEEKWGAYGNSPYGEPYFAELRLPHVKAMETDIQARVPNGNTLLQRVHSTWLCAPKVFRYLEKLIAEIGAIGNSVNKAPCFLQCEDTYPDFAANQQYFAKLSGRLAGWLDGQEERLPSLGAATPVKHWLVHLLWHKLMFHAKYEENFAKLMGQRPHGKPGTKKASDIWANSSEGL